MGRGRGSGRAPAGARCTPRLFARQPDQPLADGLALHHADQRVGRVLEAVDDVFMEGHLAAAEPGRHACLIGGQLVDVVVDDEPGHRDALVEQRLQAAHAAVLGLVVGGDHAAHGKARRHVGMPQCGFERAAADVVEIHVDAARTQLAQRRVHVGGLVVEGGVEAALLDHVGDLVVAAGRAHDARACTLGELAGQLADGPCGRGDVDGVAGRGHAQFDRTHPGSQAGHAQRGDREAWAPQRRVDAVQPFAACHDRAQRPAQEAPDEVAHREARILRGDDPRHHAGYDGLVQREAGRIRRAFVHAAAQVRVERQIKGLDDHVLRAAGGLGAGLEAETRRVGPADGAFDEQDVLVHPLPVLAQRN